MINEELENQNIQENEPTEDTYIDNDEHQESVNPEPTQESIQQKNSLEENIRLLRESKKREEERARIAEQERDQMAAYLQSLTQGQPQNVQQQQQPKNMFVNDDDFVEPKHVNYINETLEGLRKEVSQFKMHNEEITADLKLKSEFNDFHNIVTKKNVEALLNQYPEMSEIVQGQAPLYNRGKATYRLIKNFLKEQAEEAVIQSNHQSIQNNFDKPRPSVAAAPNKSADSSLNYANLFSNGYTEEVSNFLRKQMDDAIEKYHNR